MDTTDYILTTILFIVLLHVIYIYYILIFVLNSYTNTPSFYNYTQPNITYATM